ncbi:predicted Zn-dependent hydrolases of the beta-lactamase fold [Clostridium sp. CAG:780]|nr:predicted Zn-dependent hydrolases of the beta-lactamase fold [Clostridium sp. CAG:780]
MLDNIEVLYHSSIRINKEKIIYIDPFKIDRNFNDADIIFITHDHYDHYSEEDIEKVINENTTIIIPEDNDADIVFITHDHYDHYSEEDIDKVINENTTIIIPEELLTKLLRKGINKNAIITVEPNKEYVVEGIKFKTIPAYNTNKTFHPKGNDWVGYIITINNIRYYIAGDTDITEENKKVKCDVAFVPVGGTYTMDFKEAAQLINEIQPKIAIPIHYGSVVGTNQDATDFVKLLNPSIKGIILMKQ